jgi:opacity protein-like surface antigen
VRSLRVTPRVAAGKVKEARVRSMILMIMAASLAPFVPSMAAHAQDLDRATRGAGLPVTAAGSPITIGVFGGAALPSGEYEDAFAAGLDFGIRVNVRAARRVIGLHVDGEYLKNGVRTGVSPDADCSGRILAGFVNLDLGLPIPLASVRSYATAGLGYASVKLQATETSAPISSSDGTIAWNVGGGARLTLGNLFGSWGAFAEARFIRLAAVDVRLGSYRNESGAISMKPVSVGLTFHPCWACAELER